MATNAVSGGYEIHMWGRARAPPNMIYQAVALEESVEPTYRFIDPVQGQSTKAFILEGTIENPILNNYGISIIRFRQQLNHYTKFDYVVSTTK